MGVDEPCGAMTTSSFKPLAAAAAANMSSWAKSGNCGWSLSSSSSLPSLSSSLCSSTLSGSSCGEGAKNKKALR